MSEEKKEPTFQLATHFEHYYLFLCLLAKYLFFSRRISSHNPFILASVAPSPYFVQGCTFEYVQSHIAVASEGRRAAAAAAASG